ncbi:hypothetical protein BHK69_13185 [Bosea vaviloviae]|uniref:DUF11 domain-containing protein n=1 Tax=Bosea vaviloviae TaxID=1526658 RepID=A0A1D7U1N7_9HYPH|nr:hypothetical protein BHK69_13185 [Bosea vaviloviae]
MQANGTEEGFNTDQGGNVLDNKSSFTDSLSFGGIATVTIGGIEYIEFRLDLNESDNGGNPQISLNDFKIYISGAPATLSDFNNTTDSFGAGFTQVFDLAGTQALNDTNSGSGTDDYRVLIPLSSFEAAGATAASYVTLYSNLGGAGVNASNGGFEEWRVLASTASVEPVPAISIDKSGPATIAEGGATATYTFVITASAANAATDPLTIDSVVDNVFGNLTAAALAANGGNPIVLDPGETFTFTFTSPIILQNSGTTHTNVVTVTAHDDENTPVTDNDDHVISVTDLDPTVKVVKTASVSSIAEGVAASIVYSYAVTNESAASTDPLQVQSLIDDNATAGTGDDLTPTYVSGDDNGNGLIEKGETWLYQATVNGVVLNANEARTNTVEVTATDDEGNVTSDTDEATVTGYDTDPTVKVVKTASVSSIAEGVAASIVYSYAVTNESAASTDPLQVQSLIDDNATAGTGDDLTPTYVSGDDNGNGLIEKGETWLYQATVNGVVLNANEARTNTVEVTATDDEGNVTSDTDEATVTGYDTDPTVKVVKTASVSSIAEGVAASIVYSYAVTNESAASTDPLQVQSLIDDNATAGTGDDLTPTYVSGDDNGNGLIEKGETWLYQATVNGVVLNANEARTNTVEVKATDDEGNLTSDTDQATVTGANVAPAIHVDKTVSPALVQAGSASVVYSYAVTNTSPAGAYDPLSNIVLKDDNGTAANLADDFNPTYASGDDGDGLLEVGETWLYTATKSVSLAPGASLTNIVTASGTDDEGYKASDTDDATVTAFAGPGVRTPGFWSNLGQQFWDGVSNNQTKIGNSFASGELTYVVDTNKSGTITASDVRALMLGDTNKNGIADSGENTLLISLNDAKSLINASEKQQQDARYMLARDAVATWLNFMAGNPSSDGNAATVDPAHLLDDAITWLNKTSGNDGDLELAELTAATKIATSSATWQSPAFGIDHAASLLHTQLDGYNNNGKVFGVQFASDGDLVI